MVLLQPESRLMYGALLKNTRFRHAGTSSSPDVVKRFSETVSETECWFSETVFQSQGWLSQTAASTNGLESIGLTAQLHACLDGIERMADGGLDKAGHAAGNQVLPRALLF